MEPCLQFFCMYIVAMLYNKRRSWNRAELLMYIICTDCRGSKDNTLHTVEKSNNTPILWSTAALCTVIQAPPVDTWLTFIGLYLRVPAWFRSSWMLSSSHRKNSWASCWAVPWYCSAESPTTFLNLELTTGLYCPLQMHFRSSANCSVTLVDDTKCLAVLVFLLKSPL